MAEPFSRTTAQFAGARYAYFDTDAAQVLQEGCDRRQYLQSHRGMQQQQRR
jgi:hypothetical protein